MQNRRRSVHRSAFCIHRWRSAPGTPQALNRYTYALNNPLRYTDPSRHWTEEELNYHLGTGWYERYFGKDGIFGPREKFVRFLRSDHMADRWVLAEIAGFLQEFPLHFKGFNAPLRGRLKSVTMGASMDYVLNLSSGEFSHFISFSFGVGKGTELSQLEYALGWNVPTNNAYRGLVFNSVGAMEPGIGGRGEVSVLPNLRGALQFFQKDGVSARVIYSNMVDCGQWERRMLSKFRRWST